MGLFDQQNTQVTSTAPWAGAQPYLKQVMGGAQGAYQAGQGFNRYSGQAWAPLSGATQGALSGITGLAGQGNPLAGQSMGALAGILSGSNQGMGALSGILSGNNPAMQSLGSFAPGGSMASQYQNLMTSASNPYFEGALQNQVNLLGNDIQNQFGAKGRIGSAADTGALANQLGQVRTNALSNQWNQTFQNQLGALSGLAGNQLNAAGQQLGALSGAAQTQLGALGNAVQAAPGAYAQQYLPSQYQLQAGQIQDQQNQARLAARMGQYNIQQQSPWNRLNAYSGLVGGGALSGASTTTQPTNPFGMALGGALAGGSAFGPLGAVGGGLLGLLA